MVEIPHPMIHYALHLELVCDGGQAVLVPDAVQCAAAENNPLGQMDWLECSSMS